MRKDWVRSLRGHKPPEVHRCLLQRGLRPPPQCQRPRSKTLGPQCRRAGPVPCWERPWSDPSPATLTSFPLPRVQVSQPPVDEGRRAPHLDAWRQKEGPRPAAEKRRGLRPGPPGPALVTASGTSDSRASALLPKPPSQATAAVKLCQGTGRLVPISLNFSPWSRIYTQ